MRRLQRGLAPLQLGAADEVLFFQRGVALDIGRGQIALDLRGADLRLRSLRRELVVLRIELRQHLSGFDALTQLSLTLHYLAAYAKAQARLDPRAHLAGIFRLRLQRAHTDGEQLDRAHRLGRGLRLGATGQQQRGSRDRCSPRTQTEKKPRTGTHGKWHSKRLWLIF